MVWNPSCFFKKVLIINFIKKESKLKKSLLKTSLILSALLAPTMSFAHNVWLESDDNNTYVMKFGHTETESYPEEKLLSAEAINAQGEIAELTKEYKNNEFHFTISDEVSQVFLQFDNGVWSTLPNGRTVEKTRAEAPDATLTKNPMKYGKAILNWDEQATKKHDVKYELIPQGQAKVGENLPILVLVDGKAAEGIMVGESEEDTNLIPTNEQGLVMYRVQSGTNKIWAGFEETPAKNEDIDTRSIEYLLTFEVK